MCALVNTPLKSRALPANYHGPLDDIRQLPAVQLPMLQNMIDRMPSRPQDQRALGAVLALYTTYCRNHPSIVAMQEIALTRFDDLKHALVILKDPNALPNTFTRQEIDFARAFIGGTLPVIGVTLYAKTTPLLNDLPLLCLTALTDALASWPRESTMRHIAARRFLYAIGHIFTLDDRTLEVAILRAVDVVGDFAYAHEQMGVRERAFRALGVVADDLRKSTYDAVCKNQFMTVMRTATIVGEQFSGLATGALELLVMMTAWKHKETTLEMVERGDVLNYLYINVPFPNDRSYYALKCFNNIVQTNMELMLMVATRPNLLNAFMIKALTDGQVNEGQFQIATRNGKMAAVLLTSMCMARDQDIIRLMIMARVAQPLSFYILPYHHDKVFVELVLRCFLFILSVASPDFAKEYMHQYIHTARVRSALEVIKNGEDATMAAHATEILEKHVAPFINTALVDAAAVGAAGALPVPEDGNEARKMIECTICMTNRREVVFAPCSHMCACGACAPQLVKCPICNVEITAKNKVYF